MLKHKKYIQRQLYKSSRFLHKIYTLCVQEPFNDYENINDGYETESFTYPPANAVTPSACTSLLSSSLFKAILCLLAVYTSCFLSYSQCSNPCSSNFPNTKAYGHARWLMKKESISLKNRLQCHVVVLLAYLSCRGSMNPSDLLDNFYLVISFKGSC